MEIFRKAVIMNTSDLIRKLCEKQNVSISELSRRIGQSRQNLYKKLLRDTLTLDEIKQISDALGVKFEQSFTLPSGERYLIEN
jgi:transcriptional regulator with XRE-family HTH domain